MYPLPLIREVWERTKPPSEEYSMKYWKALVKVLNMPKPARFRTSFEVKKKSGGSRKIVPAKRDLVFVQSILAYWLIHAFPRSADYCYSGQGVLPAVKRHLGSRRALVVDLKSAFDYVTSEKLKSALKLYGHDLSDGVLYVLCDLMTYPVYNNVETTPQGCVSTPYAFNVVLFSMDKVLSRIAKAYIGTKMTRYSDNICFSSPTEIDLRSLEKRVTSVIRSFGFEVSWVHLYEKTPFEYLGTLIYEKRIQLDPDKYGKFAFTIMEALESDIPNTYRYQITGIFNWAYQVYGKNIPDDLLELLRKYFAKVRIPPKKLTDIVSERRMDKLL